MQKAIDNNSYLKLLTQLKKVFIEGLERIEDEKVRVYWSTGRLISDYILEYKERADYGGNLFSKLAKDLHIHARTLSRAVKFYRAFPILTARSKLSWAHFRELAYVEDKRKRQLFVERAIKKEWDSRKLEEAIRLDRATVKEPEEKPRQPAKRLTVTRARMYTYQVLEPGYIHPIDEHLTIDLGFCVLTHQEIKGLKLKAGEFIESIKSGQGYSFKHSDAKPKELYAYKALIERVVDADTLWLNIDLGFSCWTRQKVRLRGIDSPEVTTKPGQDAKRFVEARLKEVEFVVIKTYKSDKYDRYLTDVFYQKDESNPSVVLEQGTFLNQELLNEGLAEAWE